MKIGVMLRHRGEPGGIWVYTRNVLENLFELDRLNQYLLIYDGPAGIGTFRGHHNVREVAVRARSKLWWDQVSVPRLANRESLDIIYNPKLSVPLWTASKTVLVMHGAEQFVIPHTFQWWDRLYFSVANKLYCRRATAIISMTKIGARDIVHHMDAKPGKIRVIHEAHNKECRLLTSKETAIIKEKYGLPNHYLLFVGGFNPRKNIGNLLRAYATVKDSFPHDLVIVGFKRWKYAEDFKLIDDLGLRGRIHQLGYVPDSDLVAIYNRADLFVFPSLYEGFGIPVLEAMACGCPVVSSKTGCTPEVAGDAAVLVNPHDVAEISDSIARVLSDETVRKSLVAKGLARVRQFSWKKCADETLKLFESVANGARLAILFDFFDALVASVGIL
jgi:glycosyltransferase involved in cell wall biosynthesis